MRVMRGGCSRQITFVPRIPQRQPTVVTQMMPTMAPRWHALQNTSASCIRLGHDRANTANASQTTARCQQNATASYHGIPSKIKPALRYRSPAHALGILLHFMSWQSRTSFFNHTAPILERFTCRQHPSPPRVQDNCECGRCGGWTKREVEMQSAFDWVTIARPPQPRSRINRKCLAKQLHNMHGHENAFRAIT